MKKFFEWRVAGYKCQIYGLVIAHKDILLNLHTRINKTIPSGIERMGLFND